MSNFYCRFVLGFGREEKTVVKDAAVEATKDTNSSILPNPEESVPLEDIACASAADLD